MALNKYLSFIFFFLSIFSFSQSNSYRAEKEKINDLVHTKLNVSFDIPNSKLHGEAWITLTPHFLPSSKVTLDAKGMLIHSVTMNGSKVPYNYFEKRLLVIDLDKTYQKGAEFTVYVNYTSQSDTFKNDEKGLYFIDPRDEDPNKPTQIWSEGETEHNSKWFPTIDAPNQKSSQEISLTVPEKYVTLSNGLLTNEKRNTDGTRTDTWKQDLKHAPYLFFIGVGEFSVIRDQWKGKEVNYYVEKEYESLARNIFGKTPRMLQFFEDLLGVEYPWDKYSQIVVRDYVSGAMENTTAVVHSDAAYQELGELVDENVQESVISHEVIHHWFGDLVTAESWSNLAMNEAFASYGEYLWNEHEYGKDVADHWMIKEKNKYLDGANEGKKLIRFKYDSPNDLFDQVSYEKGGLILHMLRNYLGDKMFFTGLKKYLTDNKYGAAESHHLRLALEEVSGKDLNWFFNQWFLGKGHPKIQVTSIVGQFENKIEVYVRQVENVFEFPITIEVYEEKGMSSHEVWVDSTEEVFEFAISSKVKLVNIGSSDVLLSEITQHKTLEEYLYQYKHAQNYIDRRDAILYISEHQENKKAFRVLSDALNDKSMHLRILALEKIDFVNKYSKGDAIKAVENLAKNDSETLVQAAANITLAKLVDPAYIPHFIKALNSKSYKVIESAIVALYQLDKVNTLQKIEALPEKVRDNMSNVLTGYYLETKDVKNMNFVSKHLIQGLFFTQDRKTSNAYKDAFVWISKSDSKEAISNLVESLVNSGIKFNKFGGDAAAMNFLRQMNAMQKETNHSNEEELIMIIRKGMAQLVN
jgi:aminopeptidase N